MIKRLDWRKGQKKIIRLVDKKIIIEDWLRNGIVKIPRK